MPCLSDLVCFRAGVVEGAGYLLLLHASFELLSFAALLAPFAHWPDEQVGLCGEHRLEVVRVAFQAIAVSLSGSWCRFQ